MTLKSQIVDLAVAGLTDVRCAGIVLSLEDLIERPSFGGGIPQYRIQRRSDDTYITNLSEIAAEITLANVGIIYSLTDHGSSFKDKCKPVRVALKSLKVTLMDGVDDDNYYTLVYGRGVDTIVLTLGYLGDADQTNPLKIIDMALYAPNKENGA